MRNYSEQYKSKLTSAEAIAKQIDSGWVCSTDMAAGIPYALLNTIGERIMKDGIRGVRLHTMLDAMPLDFLSPQYSEGLTAVSWFSGKGLRQAVNGGYCDVMPCYYRDIPEMIERAPASDAFLCVVSPMDSHGYFSLGVNGSVSPALTERSKRIYVEVNENMPRALCAPMLHISQITALCENNAELPVIKGSPIDDISLRIGEYIADEIPDGATIQLGIGAVPNAVGNVLKEKRRLGIHTELLTDALVELVLCGAADNSLKPINRGKTVATFAYGSKKVYDFVNDNPALELRPVNYVNDPAVIAQHPCFISINSALSVDLYGQVCAESVGSLHVSGTGGQVDYVRGATRSPGGKSFIAFPSTAKGGSISRICSVLSPGSIVTTSKNDVDCIVTEYGIARLRGCTLSQRAKQLIAIAHPQFRDSLLQDAKKAGIMV